MELFSRTRRNHIANLWRRHGMLTIWDHLATLLIMVLVFVLIRALIFLPFRIPSESMMGTILVGDYIYVSKFSYGYSRYSFPGNIIQFDGRVFGAVPERGDVAVFRLPRDTRQDYIKRVIGLPGDRIQMRAGVLYINGAAVQRERVEDAVFEDGNGEPVAVPQYRETLPNGVSYMTLDLIENGMADNTGVYVVPEGHLFMMGDNRDNSIDSRFPDGVGFVPMDNLVGRAEFRFFSTRARAAPWEVWRWADDIRWGRLMGGI